MQDKEKVHRGDLSQGAVGLASNQLSTKAVEYNQIDDLKNQIEKQRYLIQDQERELLSVYRKLSSYI